MKNIKGGKMKILFLHLSDLHIKDENTFPNKKIDKMINAIAEEKNIDKIFIVLSGDLAFEGIKEQYVVIKKILEKIITKLKKTYNISDYIDVIVVPGNHDINFKGTSLSRIEIQTKFFQNKQINLSYVYSPFILHFLV
jgi:3',5'-cyclic AMP phosphodiesterase CpdA